MFSVLPSRLFSRLGAAVGPSNVARHLAAPSMPFSHAFFAPTTRRTLFTSAARLLAARPAVGTPAVGKPAAKRAAPKAKATPKPKPKAKATTKSKSKVKATAAKTKKAAKKKLVPKKKKVVKKVVKKKVVSKKRVVKKVAPKAIRITKAMGPPRAGLTPYVQFAKTNMAQHGGTFGERAKASAALWRTMSDAEKEPYVISSAASREAAKIAREKYFAEVDPLLLHQINKQRSIKKLPRVRNPNVDRRPISGYFRFSAAHRQTLPAGGEVVDVAKECGAAWRALPDAEKETYLVPARADMAAYVATHPTIRQLRKERRQAAKTAQV